MDGELRAGEEEEVLNYGEDESQGEVEPEEDLVDGYEPGPGGGDAVGVDCGDDAGSGEEGAGHEEGFGSVGDGGFEGVWMLGEADSDEGAGCEEEEEVEDVDDLANGEEAAEGVWLGAEEEGEAAGGHGKGEIGPGEVLEAVCDAEVGGFFGRGVGGPTDRGEPIGFFFSHLGGYLSCSSCCAGYVFLLSLLRLLNRLCVDAF